MWLHPLPSWRFHVLLNRIYYKYESVDPNFPQRKAALAVLFHHLLQIAKMLLNGKYLTMLPLQRACGNPIFMVHPAQ
jgi:hypothetical protein